MTVVQEKMEPEPPRQGSAASSVGPMTDSRCAPLTRADLDVGINLGGRYLLGAQRPAGRFVYEVDWMTGRETDDDNVVRQAGATWGMALLYRDVGEPAYQAALDLSLARWEETARVEGGRRWQPQPGARRGKLGASALVGLSLLERLAVSDGPAEQERVRASLDAICEFVSAARLPDGGFSGTYDSSSGTHGKDADPYSSGEALLLLTRSALELGLHDRISRALEWAEEDYEIFVREPLTREPDPDVTKGYYQWGSLIWFAFADCGQCETIWGRRLIEQALWMVDVHRTLERTRNTGYAYEGIVPAWEWARRIGDDETARKLACVIHRGLRKLCSWQLGHPLAPAALRSAPARFHGAVQNHRKESALRVDVTQHQLHALILARRYGVEAAGHRCAGGTIEPAVTMSAGSPTADARAQVETTAPPWTVKELAEVTGGTWEVMPDEGWSMSALAFERSRVQRHALVIPRCRSFRYGVNLKTVCAITGIDHAVLTDGSAAGIPDDIPRLKVPSVRNAVAAMALAARARYHGRLVAVTGSAGKTGTCDMIGNLLAEFGVPKRPTRNFNIVDGINGEVANLAGEPVAVLEVAASYLSRRNGRKLPRNVLRPDVALITSIGEAHMEYFGSSRGIAEVKSNLFDLMSHGTAVIPRDADTFDYMARRASQAGAVPVSFGTSADADSRLLSYSAADGIVEASILGELIRYKLGPCGQHLALNSVAALTVVAVLGLNWRYAAAALATTEEVVGRGGRFVAEIGSRTVTIIDDSYNANPASVRAALSTLPQRPVPDGGRRIAVLADMLELGPDSDDLHIGLAESVRRSGADSVYLVGPHMRALWDVLPPGVRGAHSAKAADLWAILEPALADGDVVLFKGSHGTDLHKVVAKLKKEGQSPTEPAPARPRASRADAAQRADRRSPLSVRQIRPLPGEASSLVSLVFVGDMSLGDHYLSDPRLTNQLRRLEADPWSFAELVAPLVQDKSLLVANLETVLSERPPDPFGGRKGYQGWDQPQRTISVLQLLGVDVVSLANNHAMDYGAKPLLETIAQLGGAGISVLGAGPNSATAAEPLTLPAPFGNLHVFAGFEFRSSYARKWAFYASEERAGVNPLSDGRASSLMQAVAKIRAEDPNSVIVVFPHWSGPSNYQWATDGMVNFNRELWSAGADLVIGHGAHRMQEVVSGSDGTTVFSLGNFIFNSLGRYRKFNAPPFSLVARVDIEQRGEGLTGSLRLYPLVSDNRATGFRPRPILESEAAGVYDIMECHSGGTFRDDFVLGHDGRGWHLTCTTDISSRLGAPRPSDSAVMSGRAGERSPASIRAADNVAQVLAARDAYDAELGGRLLKTLTRKSIETGGIDRLEEIRALLDLAEPRHLTHYMVRVMESHSLPVRAGLSFAGKLIEQSEARKLGVRQAAWALDSKSAAYIFVDSLGIRRPRSSDPVPLNRLRPKVPCCVKPISGTGGHGVFLVYAEDHIYHVRDGKTLSSWEEMIAHAGTMSYGGRRARDKKWITEELVLEDATAMRPARNLKFYTFYGEVLFVLEVRRSPGIEACYWSRDGDPLSVAWDEHRFDGDGVTNEQVALVEQLSREIPAPFMRIDMLRGEDDLVFGEFTPRDGKFHTYSTMWDRRMGEAWARAEARLIGDVIAGKRFDAFAEVWTGRHRGDTRTASDG